MPNDLQNFRAVVEHRRPGRVLCYAGFTEDLHRRVIEHIGTEDLAGHYGMFQPAIVGLKPPEGHKPIDYSSYWEGEDLPAGTVIDGKGTALTPSGFYHFCGYISPLRKATSLSEIENYPLEDLTRWDDSHMAEEVRKAHEAGKPAHAWVGHIYENAWQIRGYEQFLMDTIERPAWAECLIERIAASNRRVALAAARAGADCIQCGDDVANQKSMMFCPATWRSLLHEPWRRIWAEVKSISAGTIVWYHSDGNIADAVPALVEAGLDILNPVQPEAVDVEALHRRFGKRLSFDGAIGTQSTMPFGSPEDVRARVREVMDKFGRGGGMIVSPTHVLEPEVPLENIDAFFAACREYCL